MFTRSSPNLPLLVHLIVLAALVAWTASHLFPPINLDVGALLYVAKRWLAGDRLYVDVIDVNTPWAIALHVPAEWTAEHIGLDGPTWFSIYVCVAIAISLGLVVALLRRHEADLGALTTRVLPLAVLFALGVDPGRGFGQREHLLMIAVTPYLVLSALRARNVEVTPWLRLPIALIAGLGFAIKPHFVLPLLLVELYLLWFRGFRTTMRDVVPWVIGGVQVVHVVLAALFTPEYFSVLVPFAGVTYANPADTLRHTLGILVGPQLGPVLLILPILMLVAFLRAKPLPRLLSLFAIGAVAMAGLQGKGWDYHAIPALDAMLLLMILVITKLIEQYTPTGNPLTPEGSRIVAACLVVPFLFHDGLRLRPFMDQLQYSNSAVQTWVTLMEEDKDGNSRALVLSAGMYPQFPAMNYADYKMAMPFLTMWPLNGLYDSCGPKEQGYRPLDKQPSEEAFFFKEVVEGFVQEKPDMLVVDKLTGINDCSGKPFEYLPYFMRDPGFARAFRNYRPTKTLGQYAFYERITDAFSAAPATAASDGTILRPGQMYHDN